MHSSPYDMTARNPTWITRRPKVGQHSERRIRRERVIENLGLQESPFSTRLKSSMIPRSGKAIGSKGQFRTSSNLAFAHAERRPTRRAATTSSSFFSTDITLERVSEFYTTLIFSLFSGEFDSFA